MFVNLAKMVEIVLGMVLMVDFVLHFEHYFELHLMIEFENWNFYHVELKKVCIKWGIFFNFVILLNEILCKLDVCFIKNDVS
jgi:hypothetical protein